MDIVRKYRELAKSCIELTCYQHMVIDVYDLTKLLDMIEDHEKTINKMKRCGNCVHYDDMGWYSSCNREDYCECLDNDLKYWILETTMTYEEWKYETER